MISTVMFGFAASKALTALVNVTYSLISEANVCQTSIVISPSRDEDSEESSEPKSRQPGANRRGINEKTSIFNFNEGLTMPLPIDARWGSIDKRDVD